MIWYVKVGWPQESPSSNNKIESGHRLVAASLGLDKYSMYFNNTLERMMAYKPANIGCKYHAAKR